MMRKLRDEFNITKFETFMCDGVAAKFEAVKHVRQIKSIAVNNDKKKWFSLVKMPFTLHLDVVLAVISGDESREGRKRAMGELVSGTHKAKRARIKAHWAAGAAAQ